MNEYDSESFDQDDYDYVESESYDDDELDTCCLNCGAPFNHKHDCSQD